MKTTLTAIKVLFYAVIFLLMLWITPLRADQTNDIANLDLQSLLDNIVLSASKHEETLEETPANVFIVTREMIDNYTSYPLHSSWSGVPV
jgi:outer membrane cobalamin receptor